MKIDAHQHFWNFNRMDYTWPTQNEPDIFRNILPEDLKPLLEKTGINRTVVVQAKDAIEETDYLLELADEHDWIAGVVGWMPLENAALTEKLLEKYIKYPKFKGVRHLIHEEEDDNWIVRENVIEGLHVLADFNIPYDYVSIFPRHIQDVQTLVEKVPNLQIVIDHLAKPPISLNVFEEWANAIENVAKHPQIFAKVSGLNTTINKSDWSAKDITQYVQFAVEVFGADRLMYGSDWPVADLNGNYERVWAETNQSIATLSEKEKEAILGKTAIRFYDL